MLDKKQNQTAGEDMSVIGETSNFLYVQTKTDPEEKHKNYVDSRVEEKKVILW